jgi:hypothetical protein
MAPPAVSYGTTPATLVGNLPAGLLNLVQTGFLERFLEIGLNSVLGYNRLALRETIPSGIGETLTKNKFGRKTPVVTPINPSFMSSFDSGIVPSAYSTEQYSYTMQMYGDGSDVNLYQAEALIADQLKTFAFNNGVQAAQSLDRIAKLKLFAAYDTGNSFATANGTGTSGAGTVHVDDIRGFQTVLSNGRMVAISGSYPLSCSEISATTGAVVQTFTVTAAAADAVNTSIYPSSNQVSSDGVSGTLTTASQSQAVVQGNAVVAVGSATIIRPNAKVNTAALNAADLISMGTIMDAVTVLRNNAIPPRPNGTYECSLSNTSLRQLFADQDFKVLFAGRDQSAAFIGLDVIQMFGVTFVPNTEAYVQTAATDGSVTLGVNVERPIVSGDGALLRGDFEGMETALNKEGVSPVGQVMLVDGIAQVLRPPLDRFQSTVSLAWFWIGDFAVPTDMTATTSVIPTATSANWKRAVTIEHSSS